MTGFSVSSSESTHFSLHCFSETLYSHPLKPSSQSRETVGSNFTSGRLDAASESAVFTYTGK